MSIYNTSKAFWLTTTVVVLGGLSLVAQAQTSEGSPFATKKKKQAWETSEPAPAPDMSTYDYDAPSSKYNYPSASDDASQTYDIDIYDAPAASEPLNSYNPSESPNVQPSYELPAQSYTPEYVAPTSDEGAYYPGRVDKGASKTFPGGQYNAGDGKPAMAQTPQYAAPTAASAPQAAPVRAGSQNGVPQFWKEKFGLSSLATKYFGYFKVGGAYVDGDAPDSEAFIFDGSLTGEVSGVTDGGLEIGLGAEVRGQYDKNRRGFGGRAGDCPPGVAGCASVDINGVPTALRGHTSQFYNAGPNDEDEFEIQLEGAYLFLRSSYGDVTVGRDDGAAYLFSLGAPTLLAVNGSNSPVDYTGLDSVKTVNDASGFAEKITYTSPRLLGDSVGVGVQLGASYAPNARACGVDYCVRSNAADGTGTLAPDLEDVFEVGLSADRTFANGMKVEVTGTYATASEDSGIAAFDDLKAYNFGFEVTYNDWRMGGSYLDSNNGLQNGDYTAYDFGVTWKPAQWGISASYGHAEDDNALIESDQFVVGGIYEFDKFTLGTGVQYIDRSVPNVIGGTVGRTDEQATAFFIEGGFKF